MNKRLKIYAYLWKLFREKEFSIAEYSDCFSAINARKVLGDLVREGFVKRASRGKYSCVAPEKFLEELVENSDDAYKLVDRSGLQYAFADKDAVLVWTEGYYWSGFKPGFYPITVEVNRKDLGKWKKFFKEKDADFFVEGRKPRETFVGVVFVLRPMEKVRKVRKGEYYVVPLKEAIKFCEKNIYTFEPALEYLDKKYKLKKVKQYQYVST